VHGHVVAPPLQFPCVTALPTVAALRAAAAAAGGGDGCAAADTSLERFVHALPKHRGTSNAFKHLPLAPLRNSVWWLARLQARLASGRVDGTPAWARTLSTVKWKALKGAAIAAVAGSSDVATGDGAWGGLSDAEMGVAAASPIAAAVRSLLPAMRGADGGLIAIGVAADLVTASVVHEADPQATVDAWSRDDVGAVLASAEAARIPAPVAAVSLCWLLEAWDVVRYRRERATWEATSADAAAAHVGGGAGTKRDRDEAAAAVSADVEGATGSHKRPRTAAPDEGTGGAGGATASEVPVDVPAPAALPVGDGMPRFAIDLPIVEGAEGEFRMYVAAHGTVHPTAAMVSVGGCVSPRGLQSKPCVEGGSSSCEALRSHHVVACSHHTRRRAGGADTGAGAAVRRVPRSAGHQSAAAPCHRPPAPAPRALVGNR